MSDLDYAVVSLRLSGEDLDPDVATRVLEVEPTRAWRKGDPDPVRKRRRPRGGWILEAPAGEPRDLDAKITALLASLPGDLRRWRALGGFTPEVSCGLFMHTANDETRLSPATLASLAERGLTLALDIYGPADD